MDWIRPASVCSLGISRVPELANSLNTKDKHQRPAAYGPFVSGHRRAHLFHSVDSQVVVSRKPLSLETGVIGTNGFGSAIARLDPGCLSVCGLVVPTNCSEQSGKPSASSSPRPGNWPEICSTALQRRR